MVELLSRMEEDPRLNPSGGNMAVGEFVSIYMFRFVICYNYEFVCFSWK